jgi:arachidonate 5-lipoxygenase
MQTDVTDEEILQHLPDKDMTLSTAAITKLLSDRGTNNLGCFEKKFMFDPIGEAAHTRYGRALTGEFSLSISLSEKV